MSARSQAKKMVSSLLRAVNRLLQGITDRITLLRTRGINFVRVRYLDFVVRPDDIFVVTYPRSGTTLVQMILYQATTNGDMDFTHISQVSPWFERCCSNGMDMECFASPRILKSHLPYKVIPKGPCKYIYVTRNGMDVVVSYYHFYKSHMGYKGTISQFLEQFLRGKVSYGSWFEHVAGWQAHREDPNILFLNYEDLIGGLPDGVRAIIDFCGLRIAPERLPRILERCSFAFMKEHETHFDHTSEFLLESGMEPSSFIRKGQAGDWTSYFTAYEYACFQRHMEKRMGRLGIDPGLITKTNSETEG